MKEDDDDDCDDDEDVNDDDFYVGKLYRRLVHTLKLRGKKMLRKQKNIHNKCPVEKS